MTHFKQHILRLLMLSFVLLLPSVVMSQKGIDVSRFQDSINWKKVASNKKIEFVYIKASEGASIRDKMYRYNVKKAREAGLLVGSYHVYGSRTTAQAQFSNFKKAVGDSKQDLVPVLDIEACHCHKLSMAKVDKMLSLMEKEYGVKPMIYTSERLYKIHFDNKKYKKYHFFIANYNREPRMAYTLWQYTQRGKQNGIKGFVDFSRFSKKYGLNDIKIKKKGAESAKQTDKTKTETENKQTGNKHAAQQKKTTGNKPAAQQKNPAGKKPAAQQNKKGNQKPATKKNTAK